MTRLLTECAVAVLAIGLVAGCTSADTKTEYVDAINALQMKAFDTFSQTVSTPARNPQAQVGNLEAAESTYDEIIDELEALDVPEEAEDGHAELVAGFGQLRAVFADALSEADKADTPGESIAALSAIGTRGAAVAERIDDALGAIRQDLGAD